MITLLKVPCKGSPKCSTPGGQVWGALYSCHLTQLGGAPEFSVFSRQHEEETSENLRITGGFTLLTLGRFDAAWLYDAAWLSCYGAAWLSLWCGVAQLVARMPEFDSRLGTTGRSFPLSHKRWGGGERPRRMYCMNVIGWLYCMNVIKYKNKQKEWHTATKPFRIQCFPETRSRSLRKSPDNRRLYTSNSRPH